MKIIILAIPVIFLLATEITGQVTDKMVGNCLMSAGASSRYLKDFRIQLGKGTERDDFRFKVNIPLWKNTRYRFTMCNAEGSRAELILNIKDEGKRIILSSVDPKTKKVSPYVDFACNKSGIYELNYDFKDRQPGSGVGLVSIIK
jgi:hypothetical protein